MGANGVLHQAAPQAAVGLDLFECVNIDGRDEAVAPKYKLWARSADACSPRGVLPEPGRERSSCR